MAQRIDKQWIPLGIVLAANWLRNVLCFFQTPDLFLCWLKQCSQLPSGLFEGSLGSLIISSIPGKVKPLHRSGLMSSSIILAFSKFILWLIPCKLYQWVSFNSSIDFTCHIYMDYPCVASAWTLSWKILSPPLPPCSRSSILLMPEIMISLPLRKLHIWGPSRQARSRDHL